MTKKTMGAKTYLYPMPTVIAGATVSGKPNYITVAYCGIVNHNPAMIAITLGKSHYTNQGIKDNGTYSINIPSFDMVEVTDYVGIYSGKTTDKNRLFNAFYGKLGTAPMIDECPLNLECKLVQTLDFGGDHEVFIGEVVETYVNEKVLTNGLPDIKKINPIVFSMHDCNYWEVGEHLGRAWHIGRDYKS